MAVFLEPAPEGAAVELRRMPPGVGRRPDPMPTAPLKVGPYVVERLLGRGAMGTVYRARRDGQGPPVAVKLLNEEVARDAGAAARFAREGRAAALVNFPGVVGVTDFGQLADGQAYLVMELVEGRTLEQDLQATSALPPDEALRIAIRILTALEAAHLRGVVHRDLKPSNVFLTPDGQVKIADFGAALVGDGRRSGKTDAGLVLGSPAYMAPEQALGRATDDRADIYSLGCVLYRMLAGRPPFHARTLVEVLRLQIEERPAPVKSPHGALPVLLVEAVERALAKDPEERFYSAGEMRAVLEQALVRLDRERRR
jgi:serine/threonine-protein kinase